jgi:predicted nucleic acid-binding protein
MVAKIRIFLDTSAIFAGIWSARGGGRVLLGVGEAGAIALVTSRSALQELEGALRAQAPEVLGTLALLLDRAQFTIVGPPDKDQLGLTSRLVDHPGDANILGSALGGQVEFFVTLDQKHFLANDRLVSGLPFQLGTPGECLDWLRRRLRVG